MYSHYDKSGKEIRHIQRHNQKEEGSISLHLIDII